MSGRFITEPDPEPKPNDDDDESGGEVVRNMITDDQAERIREELPSGETPTGEIEKQIERVEEVIEQIREENLGEVEPESPWV